MMFCRLGLIWLVRQPRILLNAYTHIHTHSHKLLRHFTAMAMALVHLWTPLGSMSEKKKNLLRHFLTSQLKRSRWKQT